MSPRIQINDQFTVGKDHPAEADLKELEQAGFQTVINLRAAGEDKQPQSPEEEGRMVRDLGMAYQHYPVKSDAISPDLVDGFRERLRDLPRPIFVHCASGKRSGAFVMMHLAIEEGMTGQETVEKAASMGFECDTPELEQFVTSYVDGRRTEA
jgi:uncharacterized protein (TIGR01244 family)